MDLMIICLSSLLYFIGLKELHFRAKLKDAACITCRYMVGSRYPTKSKGLFDIHRDIRISTYQNCKIEEKINRTTPFHK